VRVLVWKLTQLGGARQLSIETGEIVDSSQRVLGCYPPRSIFSGNGRPGLRALQLELAVTRSIGRLSLCLVCRDCPRHSICSRHLDWDALDWRDKRRRCGWQPLGFAGSAGGGTSASPEKLIVARPQRPDQRLREML
jgi:hypothetical protein